MFEQFTQSFLSSTLYKLLLNTHWFKMSHNNTVYPKKYAHGFVVLCFVVVMQSLIMNSHEVFIHIHQGCLMEKNITVTP